MAYQQREGQGSLFKNDKQNERQPDFKGSIMIKGVLYNVSAWNRTSQNGREYISLQAEERTDDGQQQGNYSPRPQQPAYSPAPSYNPAPAYEPAPQMDIPAPGLDDIPMDDLPF